MERKDVRQFSENLKQKRQNLENWMEATPAPVRQTRLGPAGERAVKKHLHVLEATLEQVEGDTFGVCRVCGESVDEVLLEMDYTSQVCLGHFSEEELRQLEYELELSQIVQRAMLPQDVPQIPGMSLAAFNRPAQIVGGDFFDFLQFHDGRHAIVIADVAGKGVSASLIMASIQTALRTLVPVSDSSAGVLSQLNRLFAHNIHFTTFVTLFLGAYDPVTHTLVYCNAGHNPPLVYRRTNGTGYEIHALKPCGAAIGLVEDPQFHEASIHLAPDDLLFLYTDGVSEAINPRSEEFGVPRLEAFLHQNASLPPRDLITGLRRELETFTASPALVDDATIIACRIEGNALVG